MRASGPTSALRAWFGGAVGSALAILLVAACLRGAPRKRRGPRLADVSPPLNREAALAAAQRGQKFTCPFCEEPAWRGVFQGTCVVAHRTRSCTPFDTMSAEDFVTSCALLSLAQARRKSVSAVTVLH